MTPWIFLDHDSFWPAAAGAGGWRNLWWPVFWRSAARAVQPGFPCRSCRRRRDLAGFVVVLRHVNNNDDDDDNAFVDQRRIDGRVVDVAAAADVDDVVEHTPSSAQT